MKEKIDGGRVKGGLIHAHVEWLRQRRGDSAIEELASMVNDDAIRSDISITAWYPFPLLISVDRSIAAISGGEERATVIELGRHSARENITRNYRPWGRPSPAEFFQELARLHPRFQDFGHIQFQSSGKTSCSLIIVEPEFYSPIYCWSSLGFYEQAVRMLGGERPMTRKVSCVCKDQSSCRVDVHWSEA